MEDKMVAGAFGHTRNYGQGRRSCTVMILEGLQFTNFVISVQGLVMVYFVSSWRAGQKVVR